MSTHRVTVGPIPQWIPAPRLLGPGEWAPFEGDPQTWEHDFSREVAADVQARLRGVGLGGHPLVVRVHPGLKRPHIRAARTRDARRRRQTTPGFTRKGVVLDEEGKVSLTPESLAQSLGQRFAGRSVVDAGCGVGGNTIGFARSRCRVLAVENSGARLTMARHNAGIYGVADRVEFVGGDAVIEARQRTADVLFCDPPWGVDWDRTRAAVDDFPLLAALLDVFHQTGAYGSLVAKVPPSFDPATVDGARAEAWFGEADGDRYRVKFVTITVTRGG